MDLVEMVSGFLRLHKFDGLYSPGECACELGDLMPCGTPQCGCKAGYRCACGEDCKEEECDKEQEFHVGPKKRE